MIELPDEIRLGVPDEHDDADEIHASAFRIWRDEHDGRNADAQISLSEQQHHRLRRFLEQHSDEDTVTFVIDVPMPMSGMPPDPMGPALIASNYYVTQVALQSLSLSPDVTAPDGGFLLAQAMCFYRNITGVMQGLAPTDVNQVPLVIPTQTPPPPPIPVPLTLPTDLQLQALTNGLLASATVAIAKLTAAPAEFTGTAFTVCQNLYDEVHSVFRGSANAG